MAFPIRLKQNYVDLCFCVCVCLSVSVSGYVCTSVFGIERIQTATLSYTSEILDTFTNGKTYVIFGSKSEESVMSADRTSSSFVFANGRFHNFAKPFQDPAYCCLMAPTYNFE